MACIDAAIHYSEKQGFQQSCQAFGAMCLNAIMKAFSKRNYSDHRLWYYNRHLDIISYDDYLSLTIHYLDTNFCLHHCCLEVVPFPEVRHTVQNICQFLTKLVSDWDVSQKVVAVLRDNGRNISAGLEMSSFEHIPCLAHTFNLVSKDGLLGSKIVTNLLSQSRRLAGHFKHSAHAVKF
ncbi:hypothetical protein PR048_013540 [Dryococelus australis]|uniref:Uncharacterized protein n=1 Tax=Dryococelus australis TaxID=614101 RepID=A0ABQ9HSG4_9NEOP|nr:hypothetical protein PR048_013540 [Dryococelus australis]